MCRYRIYTIVSSLAFGCLSVFGQENPESAYEFEFIRNTNPWLISDNAAGLGTLQVPRTSFVEAYFDKDDGGLIPVEGSDNSLEAGALTESYVRISDRIAFHGKLSYSYFQGKNMNGHYLMDPSYNPINFLESTSFWGPCRMRWIANGLWGCSLPMKQGTMLSARTQGPEAAGCLWT